MEGAETNEINDNTSSMSSTTVAADNCREKLRDNKTRKRHEFSDFLMTSGVSSALANVLLELLQIEERPTDPIEYVRAQMRPDNEDQAQIARYRQKIDTLNAEYDRLVVEKNRLLAVRRRIKTIYYDGCDGDEQPNY